MAQAFDAVVVGSGPNGLAAAIALAAAGFHTHLIEGHAQLGGGMRTAELTLPGFHHDVCSAVHPLGALSPYFTSLPLKEHGLHWAYPESSAAHPLDDGSCVVLERSVAATAEQLGRDGRAYRRLMEPFVRVGEPLIADLLGPLRIPRHPFAMARFGFYGLRPLTWLARGLFDEPRAQALIAGCGAHAILPLDKLATGAVGLLFAFTGHLCDWPMARGGSAAIGSALASYFRSLGGSVTTGQMIRSLDELPASRVVLFDLAPKQLSAIAGDALPARYRARLGRYRYGPAAFKLDWALSSPIPWRDARCAGASTVHVGGTLDEIAAAERATYDGQSIERPFVMVTQQSHFDETRAPSGKHTGYAYCHVPHGSTEDYTARVEAQIERFAPGFRDCILARHVQTPRDLEAYNPSLIGGVIAGGEATLDQIFTRPVLRLDPYSTPNPKLFLCGASTPPAGGVHGMCGYFAAQSAIKRLKA